MSVGYRPKTGASVFWENGEVTAFTDTGDVFPNTPQAFYRRYGRPRVVADPGKRSLRLRVEAETVFVQLGRALINAAADPANPWGLKFSGTEEATPLEAYDFAATQMPTGWEGSGIKRRYFDQPGSTPPPPTRPPKPPKPPVEPPSPSLPPALSTPEQRAAELHAWVGQKWEAAKPWLIPIIAELVVMFRKAVGK